MTDQPTFAPPEARQAAADAYDDAAVRKVDVGQMTAAVADAVWAVAEARIRRQASLPDLVHFERPSDFRKGVLTCLAALEAREEAPGV